MSLTPEDVIKIAHLARLDLPKDSIERYTIQLSGILKFIEEMNKVDTTDVAALAHPLDISQRLRNDVVSEVDLREKFQHIAPQVEAGLYLVPKVIEEA